MMENRLNVVPSGWTKDWMLCQEHPQEIRWNEIIQIPFNCAYSACRARQCFQ